VAVDMTNSGLNEYRKVHASGNLADASPHRVVQVMLQTAIDRLAEAKGHMDRDEPAAKSEAIGKALAIVEALQLSLDAQSGGEVARNLNDLYEYMTRTLLQANAGNNGELVDEVVNLLGEIKSGWDGIAPVD